MTSTKPILFSEIENILNSISSETISQERKEIIQPLIDFIQEKVTNKKEVR